MAKGTRRRARPARPNERHRLGIHHKPRQPKHILPTKMTYRYKHGKSKTYTARKSRCPIRGDQMKSIVHFDSNKTVTHMADRTTILSLHAIAASTDMHVEHFDITGAYLQEKYQHTKTVFVWQRPRFNGTYKHQRNHRQLKGNLYGIPAASNIYSTELHIHFKNTGTNNSVQTSPSS